MELWHASSVDGPSPGQSLYRGAWSTGPLDPADKKHRKEMAVRCIVQTIRRDDMMRKSATTVARDGSLTRTAVMHIKQHWRAAEKTQRTVLELAG